MERALVSLTKNDSFVREDDGEGDEDDVEEEADDYDSFMGGQLTVKIEWRLDIFRLAVFPVSQPLFIQRGK